MCGCNQTTITNAAIDYLNGTRKLTYDTYSEDEDSEEEE
jgi:hypothetical protein